MSSKQKRDYRIDCNDDCRAEVGGSNPARRAKIGNDNIGEDAPLFAPTSWHSKIESRSKIQALVRSMARKWAATGARARALTTIVAALVLAPFSAVMKRGVTIEEGGSCPWSRNPPRGPTQLPWNDASVAEGAPFRNLADMYHFDLERVSASVSGCIEKGERIAVRLVAVAACPAG
jgi:hypothetical protein